MWRVKCIVHTHTVGCSTIPLPQISKSQKFHSECLDEWTSKTSLPVLDDAHFTSLEGNWLWWIYKLYQWSFHWNHDVLDDEHDVCHFWYRWKGIDANRFSQDSRWRRGIFVAASLKSHRSFMGALLSRVLRECAQREIDQVCFCSQSWGANEIFCANSSISPTSFELLITIS